MTIPPVSSSTLLRFVFFLGEWQEIHVVISIGESLPSRFYIWRVAGEDSPCAGMSKFCQQTGSYFRLRRPEEFRPSFSDNASADQPRNVCRLTRRKQPLGNDSNFISGLYTLGSQRLRNVGAHRSGDVLCRNRGGLKRVRDLPTRTY